MTQIRLGSAAEAKAILAAEDDFTRALSSFDRSFRLRTTEPVSDEALRAYLGEQAQDFTAEEAQVWEETIANVAKGARGLGALLPPEVLVIKTTGHEERNHAYTRAHAIVLPAERVKTFRGDRAIYLLAHELFHVVSRAAPALRDATYALLGFARLPEPLPFPAALDDKRLSNPDAHGFTHAITLEEGTFVPLLTSPVSLADALKATSVVGAMQVSLLPVSGAPDIVEASKTSFPQRIARNTKYTIHPEEVLADNHAILVRRRLGMGANITHPEFLEAFEAALYGSGHGVG